MDTISAGNVLAFSMECFEKGLLTAEDTHGLNLRFADQESMITALSQIAYRSGFGNVLAEGVKRASKIIGAESEKFAVHVKGLEPPGYDPRALKGVALSYAVSCRGACHLRHLAHRPNLTGLGPFEPENVHHLSYEGHGSMIARLEDFYTVVDSMGLCKFVCLPSLGPILWEELTTLYNIVTGLKAEKKDLITKAVRINSLVNSINKKMRISRKVDTLPRRFLEEPLENGASKGEIVDRTKLRTMITQYYSARKLTQIAERKDPENTTTKE